MARLSGSYTPAATCKGVPQDLFYSSAATVRRAAGVFVAFEADGIRGTLSPSPAVGRVRETDLGLQLRPLIAKGNDPHRDILLGLLARQPYAGEDTLAKMGTPVFLEMDEAIATGSGGLVLMGWFLAYPGEIQQIRLRSGPAISILDLDSAIRINRPDVLDGFRFNWKDCVR